MALILRKIKFDFYHQIRVLLRSLRKRDKNEAVFLDRNLWMTSTLSLSSPDGDIESLFQENSDDPINIVIGRNGLTGMMGALPLVYSEWMIERQYRYGDVTAKSFIDLFGHRLYCLDYLAWKKNHISAAAESCGYHPLQMPVLALTGLLNSIQSPAMAEFAAFFISTERSQINLERWLSLQLSIQVEIIPFTGSWYSVSSQEICMLGNSQQILGVAPTLGRVRLEREACFDVVLGPVNIEQLYRFILEDEVQKELVKGIRNYVGPLLNFSVFLIVCNDDIPIIPLGEGMLGKTLRLGINAEHSFQKIFLINSALSKG
ncbi:type VI secretion system baseplate subunit TssG [Salmonella enterica subsp. enterica]|nr:type VI secretion system baseplate subunit TssG [Salmonella enterica subsp. enterica serovar Mikawasima]EJQ8143244.1 type VI secretion system baseplate subunit TssG [Salmonella enterica]MIO70029.1 type VI secretion system baseplate subunit TssG [Salmonella enterica subsp. enterica serovar Mikawasima]